MVNYAAYYMTLRGFLQVCKSAEVDLHMVPLTNQYWDRVVSHSIAEIKAGRTPNPDILCNSRSTPHLFEHSWLHTLCTDTPGFTRYAQTLRFVASILCLVRRANCLSVLNKCLLIEPCEKFWPVLASVQLGSAGPGQCFERHLASPSCVSFICSYSRARVLIYCSFATMAMW